MQIGILAKRPSVEGVHRCRFTVPWWSKQHQAGLFTCDNLIVEALEKGRGSRKFAAEALGISPRTLRYKMAKMR